MVDVCLFHDWVAVVSVRLVLNASIENAECL